MQGFHGTRDLPKILFKDSGDRASEQYAPGVRLGSNPAVRLCSPEGLFSADCVENLPFGDVRFSGTPMGAVLKKSAGGPANLSIGQRARSSTGLRWCWAAMFHRIAIWRVFVTLDFSTFSTSGNGRQLFPETDRIGSVIGRGGRTMEYFAGLDVSMAETHVCVVTRNGAVIHQAKVPSTPADIAAELAQVPTCRRVLFETGRMAPMLYHGLSQLGLPVVCVESRQAYQALKSLATHKTDRNDARGLAHLARTGFFKPVHVKSLPAHAVRSLIIARKKLVGQRVTLENQIRGLAVVFGVRLPRALSPAFIRQALRASEGISGLSAAMRGLVAARAAVLAAVVAIDADIRRMVRAAGACRRRMSIPGVGQLTALAFTAAVDNPGRFRRSRDIGAYLGLVPRRHQSGEIDYTGSISKCGDRRVRTLLYEAANVMLTRYKGALKLKEWAFAVAKRSTMRKARIALARRPAIIMHAMLRNGTEFKAA